MAENVLLGMMIGFVALGLILMCGALFQISRHGFQQVVMEGKRPAGRFLFFSALTCFVVALLSTIF